MRRFAKGEKVFVKEKMLRIFFSKFDCLFLPVEKLLTCLAFRSLKKDKNIFEGKDFSPLRFFLVWSLMRDFLINIIQFHHLNCFLKLIDERKNLLSLTLFQAFLRIVFIWPLEVQQSSFEGVFISHTPFKPFFP